MHTNENCTIAGSGQTGLFTSSNCDHAANDNSGCGSVANDTATPNNYGQALSENGGGVYVTEWTSAYVRVWFFGRENIPSSITSGSPDVSEFGLPMANFQGSCDIDSHFKNHSIIINTDFCGAWAGFAYERYPECPITPGLNGFDSCVDYVGTHPEAFVDAYWEINSIKVYQLPIDVSPSSVPTSTASLSSSSPVSANQSIINPGMGQSTSSLPLSVPYTGPLSSVVSSATTSSATVSATPIICDTYNNTIWTNYNGQSYRVSCGSDFVAQSINGDGNSVNSFEACLELCDGTDGCSGVSYLGGNGAGTCMLKTGKGELDYDGHTFAAVVFAGNTSAYPTASTTTLTTTSTTSSTFHKTATLRPSHQPSTCPQADNVVLMDENEVEYIVYCSSDTVVDSFDSSTIDGGGFTACFTICDVTPGCVGFTFVGASSGTCYFKNQFGGTKTAPANFVVAFLADNQSSASSSATSAPSANSTPATSSVEATLSVSSNVLSSSAESSALSVFSSLSSTTSTGSSNPPSSSAETFLTTSPSSSESSSTSVTAVSSSSSSPQIVYYVAPPCPSTVENICDTDTPTTCSNPRGSNFNVRCGSSYTGTTIEDNNGINRFRIMKRVTEPSYADCLDLCDDTTGCVGVNYKGDECTLFSEITGTVPDPDNVAATLLPPEPVTSSGAATSSPTASTLPTTSSESLSSIASSSSMPTTSSASFSSTVSSTSIPMTSSTSLSSTTDSSSSPTASSVSLSSTGSSSSPVASPSSSELACPGSAGSNYTDKNGVNYTIACGMNFQGGDLSTAIRADSLASCLPSCDNTPDCIGVVYNTATFSCQMKSSFAGSQVPDTSIIIAVRTGVTDPGLSSSYTLSTSSAVSTSSSASISSSVTLTITTCKISSSVTNF